MNQSDKKRFAVMWGMVRSEIYDKPVSATGINLVFNALKRFSIAQVERGIELHCNDTQNGQFPITPAHVVSHIEGNGDELSGIAWGKLYRSIGEVGAYSDVVFDDPIIHAIIENEGGWVKVALMIEDDLKYMQSRFNKQYLKYVSKSGAFNYPKLLTGMINTERRSKGLEPDPPITIGDVAKCRDVYRGGIDNKLEIGRTPNAADLLKIETNQEGKPCQITNNQK